MQKPAEPQFEAVADVVFNHVKVYMLRAYGPQILRKYNTKIDQLVRRYMAMLPPFVAQAERDDLKTISQLEFLETLKNWDPYRNADVWPLAFSRITGAMKDHIRYVTKSDPSRFQDWMNDVGQELITSDQESDFAHNVEQSVQLDQAMAGLSVRERRVITLYAYEDLTFLDIGKRLGVSESQISRIYKKAVEKLRKQLHYADHG